jgi:hypothetical protein
MIEASIPKSRVENSRTPSRSLVQGGGQLSTLNPDFSTFVDIHFKHGSVRGNGVD